MQQVDINDLEKDDTVYYIPRHLPKTMQYAEKGHVSTIKNNRVWVRYNGPQGNLTPIKDLYV